MSHFTVLVIGKDPEEQLAPYHEFECTGQDDQYVQDVDTTEEILSRINEKGESLEDALGYYGLEDRQVESEAEVDKTKTHKYGYAVVRDGKLIKAVDRTNPNRKWDWYVLGGRWTGYFKLKEGKVGERGSPGLFSEPAAAGWADQALKGDIDFEGMISAWKAEAEQRWDEAHAESADERSSQLRYFRYGIQEGDTKESYAERSSSVATFAVLKDGVWYEKGEMGWFGMASNEKDAAEWSSQFNKMLLDLPDDTLLSLYDCHI